MGFRRFPAMEFDEYDYLEKSVDVPCVRKHTGLRDSRHRFEGEKDAGDRRSREPKKFRTDENGGAFDRSDRREKDYRRSGDKDRERDRDHRERDREKEKEKDRHREREREMDRHREREKEKDRYRERETERSRDRESEKEMDLDRETERSRRSRSSSRKHDIEYLREKERSRSREMRERDERDSRESRRFREKKEPLEAEADPERDQRTVFAYQMPLKATERDVYEFFSKVGKVRDVRLIMDRNSRRSKGVGYIEFYDAMSVPMAIALSGHQLLGQPVMVKPSEAEKNLVQSNTSGALGAAGARKIYVGNLHFNITEDLLRQVFEPFGHVELVQLPLDPETGHCRGYGFIQFSQVEYAKAAQSLNGKLDIAGRIIKVSAVTENVVSQESGTNATDFDDDDGGGLSMNARSRAILMQKLDRTGTASSIVESLGVPVLNGVALSQPVISLPRNGQATIPAGFPAVLATTIPEPIGEPSEFILLKNMFHPSTETDPDFDLDIKEDVQEECVKFGPLKHIYVDKYCNNGSVYLRFESVAAAVNCQRAMHMRWFAGRSISATFMKSQDYDAKFRSSL
ncbi:RNA-binding protein 39-like [Phalaenopsis equestris]|uniref:RNA-binding protein 39-like n=1 Tax=Phalaenopsis equestris TaxID=78828 RepID=UPI0009E4FAF6|nr:RNA-binding protein 39-like [Phalaenopsis equestris]